MAWSAPSVVRVAGAVGVVAMAVAVGLDRDVALLRGRVVAAMGLTVLIVADAGLPAVDALGDVDTQTLWRPLAAVVAYPVLGRAMIIMVGRYRMVRASDVVVEAALVGSAAAIALQVLSTTCRETSGWEPAWGGHRLAGGRPRCRAGRRDRPAAHLGRSPSGRGRGRGRLGRRACWSATSSPPSRSPTGRLPASPPPHRSPSRCSPSGSARSTTQPSIGPRSSRSSRRCSPRRTPASWWSPWSRRRRCSPPRSPCGSRCPGPSPSAPR